MEIHSVDKFLAYFDKMRETTRRVAKVIPPDQLDWSYAPGKFTIGDLLRHIAAIEREVFAEVVKGRSPNYLGCGKELADGLDGILSYMDQMHEESMAIFRTLSDADLRTKVTSLDGTQVEVASILRAAIIHEVHHRGALCVYINSLGVPTPSILGFNEQQVIQVSQSKNN